VNGVEVVDILQLHMDEMLALKIFQACSTFCMIFSFLYFGTMVGTNMHFRGFLLENAFTCVYDCQDDGCLCASARQP